MAPIYNAFISYAWRDNQPCGTHPQGWVSVFVDRLTKQLNKELPRALAANGLWLDYEQMRGWDRVQPKIEEKLKQSQLLVPFISKAWLDSPWCQDELRIFLEQHGPEGDGRLFPVWMDSIEKLPPPLNERLKYKFWYQDQARQPRTRWFPDPDPTDRTYSDLQQDLTRDMAVRLQEIAAGTPPAPDAPPGTKLPPPPNGRHLILISGGDDDRALMDQVAERLHQHHGLGYALPLRYTQGLKSSAINADLRAKLGLCTAVLLVYRDGPEHQVHRHIDEILKARARRTQAPPSLDLC